jgi:hypothetical protein
MNDVELKWKKINALLGEFYRVVKDRAYTHDEIKKMVAAADLRDKAIILLLKDWSCRSQKSMHKAKS